MVMRPAATRCVTPIKGIPFDSGSLRQLSPAHPVHGFVTWNEPGATPVVKFDHLGLGFFSMGNPSRFNDSQTRAAGSSTVRSEMAPFPWRWASVNMAR